MPTTRLIKVIISIVMSLIAATLYLTLKGEERKKCMYAMFACTLGDIFMVDIFGLGDVSTYPGAGFFMLGHVIYALAFISASKRKGYKIVNGGFKTGLVFVIAMTVVLAVLAFVVPEKPETVMFFLILVYIAVITFNLVCQFSYATNEKGGRLMLIAAMTLFFVSDWVIFLNMLAITPAHNDLVWATYIPAQMFIIIFNSGKRARESVTR